MALQFLVGAIVSVVNIMIHALVTVAAISIARTAALRYTAWPRSQLMGVMVVTAAVLMVAHTLEVSSGHWPMRSSVRHPPAAISFTSPSSTTQHSATATLLPWNRGG